MIDALVNAQTDASIEAAMEEIFEMWDQDQYAEEITDEERAASEAAARMLSVGKSYRAARAKMLEMLNLSSEGDPGPVEGGRKTRKTKKSRKTKKTRKTKRRTTRRA